MTREQLDALRALLANISRGEWSNDNRFHNEGWDVHNDTTVLLTANSNFEQAAHANTAAVVALVNAAPELLALAELGLAHRDGYPGTELPPEGVTVCDADGILMWTAGDTWHSPQRFGQTRIPVPAKWYPLAGRDTRPAGKEQS